MFCPNCGTEGSGKFCTNCGKPLAPTEAEPAGDWTVDASYRSLVSRSQVRDLIKTAGAGVRAGMSGEEFMDKFLFKRVALSAPLLQVAYMPLAQRFGIKTGKGSSQEFELPIGRAIVATLCALASRNERLKSVTEVENGCTLEAALPSDVWATEGRLKVAIAGAGNRTTVNAATEIPGQLFDWGKSKRTLAMLFDDIRGFASQQPH